MFREFFWSTRSTSAVAWAGAVVVVGYAFFLAIVKAQLNEFYARFYDLLQKGGDVDQLSGDSASGEVGDPYAVYRAQVASELWSFALIVTPLVSATPACKWARSAWAFLWRAALMRAYLVEWDTQREPIEGASQRLHEDTQRFSSGVEGCLITVLDAVFTLFVFTPILLQLSIDIPSPCAMGELSDAWLWCFAFFASLVGLTGAAILGQKLVGLEVCNQKVEALLRKDLVLLETTPAVIVGTQPSSEDRHAVFLPQTYFRNTLESLQKNYFLLFKHFGVLNFWLSFFDQVMVIAPYALAAPLIFAADPARRITLGTLMKMSNSFEKFFSSLSVIRRTGARSTSSAAPTAGCTSLRSSSTHPSKRAGGAGRASATTRSCPKCAHAAVCSRSSAKPLITPSTRGTLTATSAAPARCSPLRLTCRRRSTRCASDMRTKHGWVCVCVVCVAAGSCACARAVLRRSNLELISKTRDAIW